MWAFFDYADAPSVLSDPRSWQFTPGIVTCFDGPAEPCWLLEHPGSELAFVATGLQADILEMTWRHLCGN